MSWSKLSDDYSDDCWTLSDAAFRLHTEALVWTNRKLLDCRIPKDDLPRFAKRPEAVDELLAVGWWSDDGDHYVIRHHAGYQRTREQVVKRQQTSAANGQKGGRPLGRERAAELTPDNPLGNLVANPVENLQGQDRTGFNEEQPTTEVLAVSRCVTCLATGPVDSTGECRTCTKAWAS